MELVPCSLQLIPSHSTIVFLHFALSSYIETLMIFSCRQQPQPFPVSTGPTVLPGDSSVSLFFSFSFFTDPIQHQFTSFKLLVPATTPSFLAGDLASKSTEKLCRLLIRNWRDSLLESSLQFSSMSFFWESCLSYSYQFCVFTLGLSPAPCFYN